MKRLGYEQVVKRNRRHPSPRWGEGLTRGGRLRLHFEDHHRETERSVTFGSGWKQPGRRFGPSPLGPDVPKANKVTDSDGNARIFPLSMDQRHANYLAANARRGLADFTPKQRRRSIHKTHHGRAPFGKEAG